MSPGAGPLCSPSAPWPTGPGTESTIAGWRWPWSSREWSFRGRPGCCSPPIRPPATARSPRSRRHSASGRPWCRAWSSPTLTGCGMGSSSTSEWPRSGRPSAPRLMGAPRSSRWSRRRGRSRCSRRARCSNWSGSGAESNRTSALPRTSNGVWTMTASTSSRAVPSPPSSPCPRPTTVPTMSTCRSGTGR